MTQWQPYLIALVIGLLVGIEREKSHPHQKTMGIRTFVLISLLGAIAADLHNLWLATLLTLFALGLILISYFTQTNSKLLETDRGLTTEFAAGIVYCLAYQAHQEPMLAAIIGPVVAVILFSKATLHRFTRALKPSEFQAALLLLLAGVVIINLIPDKLVDPWDVFNPRKFGYLVLTLATLEFSSYVIAKIMGEKASSLVIGFLGGFASSTVVLFSSARQAAKTPSSWRSSLCSAISAQIAAFLELLFIIALISPGLFLSISIPIVATIFWSGFFLIFLTRKKQDPHSTVLLKSPLDWKGVFRLSIVLGTILILISVGKRWLGENATIALSFLTGLFELHGTSLANATMYSHGQLSDKTAIQNILIAVIASLIVKTIVSWVIDWRGSFARVLTSIQLPMVVIITLSAWLILF